MTLANFPELKRLSPKQRLKIAAELWDSVADENKLPVPASHRRIVRQRMSDYKAGKTKAISHEELMRRVRRA